MDFIELTNEQRRQLIDSRQVHEAYWTASKTLRHRYAGSMRWLTRKGRDYLHRKIGRRERSLGPRNDETEAAYEAFIVGRESCRDEVARLRARLDQMAPVNRALNLGRLPRLTARILRVLAKEELLGKHLLIIGTNALFAYEARAGVMLPSELLATADADLLWDVRAGVTLLTPEVRQRGLLALLKSVDRSFNVRGPSDFRAFNRDGFYVDLIRPQDKDVLRPTSRRTIGETNADLHGVPIQGLAWMLNAPRFEAVAMGEDGYPLQVVTVDPRAFALHKLWVSRRDDRDPLKRPRDTTQAEVVTSLAQVYLGLGMDDEALSGLPRELRDLKGELWG